MRLEEPVSVIICSNCKSCAILTPTEILPKFWLEWFWKPKQKKRMQAENFCLRAKSIDWITGELPEVKCEVCRKDSKMCGVSGKWYSHGSPRILLVKTTQYLFDE